MGIFKKKQKKNTGPAGGSLAPESLQGISSGLILIRVFKDFGSGVPILKAQYAAEEKRDEYNNLVAVNEQFGHNEDMDFSLDDVYREMNSVLKLGNLSRQEKLDKLDSQIEHQDKILKYLNKHIKLNSIFNYADEEIKQRDYKLLRNHIAHNVGEKGSFFTIENGARVYSYVSVDGFLVPIWHGEDNYSQYPDHTRKKKINVQEEKLIKEELAQMKKENLQMKAITLIILVNIVIFLVLSLGVYKVWDYKTNIDSRANEVSLMCAENIAKVTGTVNDLLQNTLVKETIEYQTAKNAQNNPPPKNSTESNIKQIYPK